MKQLDHIPHFQCRNIVLKELQCDAKFFLYSIVSEVKMNEKQPLHLYWSNTR